MAPRTSRSEEPRARKARAPSGAPGSAGTRPAPSQPRHALALALRRLDAVLGAAVERQAARLGPGSLLDPWLGMHLDAADVQRLLQGQQPPHAVDAGVCGLLADALREVPDLASVAQAFELDDVDLAILLVALAPDVDLRYERIYGYLQDDLTRRRPSPDLVANLLACDTAQRLAVCARFSRAAPLLRSGVLVAGDDARSPLAQEWRVDRIWRVWLLQGDLADAIELGQVSAAGTTLASLPVEPATRLLLEQACALAHTLPLRLCLHGEHGAGKLDAAVAISQHLHRQLVPLDLRECTSVAQVQETLQRAGRAACLFAGLLYLHGLAPLEQRDPQLLRAVADALDTLPCHLVLSCVRPPAPGGRVLPWLRVELAWPSAHARHALWREAAAAVGAPLADPDAAALASRFSLGRVHIAQAAAEAQVLALAEQRDRITYADAAAAVRRQCGSELARLATRIAPRAGFDSLVAPAEVLAQLHEICARVATRELVANDWGAASVHARAAGITALFVGPSGTGKTLSAEAVAGELGLDLFRIDLASVVSKYIGETEKNLDRVFSAAVHANAVLFFDEADALFGKRSEVKDAHDRYANIEVSYLLQKMEQFDGLAILASNLKQNIDEAFARRLTFTVSFPFPEEPERRRLWEALWPPRAPRAADVDLGWFAHEFRLSGGNIRNTALAAAHLAAADGRIVTRAHLLHATRREYQKLGKNLAAPAEGMKP